MADDVVSQSPTPSTGGEGADLRSVARQVEGLLDDDGQFNPNPDQVSRGHPDYDESTDERAGGQDRDDRGRFKAAAEDDQDDEQSDDDESHEDLAADDDQDEDTDIQDDGDTDDDQAGSADDEAETDDAETGDIESLAQLAEALDVPLDELKAGLSHTFNAAGEELTVTLAELESGYQKDADYRRNTAKLAQDRQTAEQEFNVRHQGYEQQNQILAGTMQMAEQIVAAELNDPRLAELRESDPAEWTARREEIGNRLQGLRNTRMQAAQAYEQFTGNAKQQLRQREEQSLLAAMPDFGKQHRDTAKELMGSMGYAPQEISEVFDHRLILGVLELANARTELASLREEAAEFRKLKKQAGKTVKRIKKDVPKLTKPGKQRSKKGIGVKRDNLARLRKRANQSGKVEDAAKVIEHLI